MLDWLKGKVAAMTDDSSQVPDSSDAIHEADAVYGINRDLPLNYVERGKVDLIFSETLRRNKHVIVYGSSKQGKTSLRKKWLADEDYIVVSCLNTMNLSDLHGAILKAAGYRIEQSVARTVGGHFKFNAEFRGKGKVPLIAEAEVGTGFEGERDLSNATTTKRLEIDLQDVNDVVAALREAAFDQHITLEDFHYLPVDTQKAFAFALKAFHENSKISFIIIGVWREKNRIIYYNGDLTGRVVAIDADEWTKPELEEVISSGEQLLNISFDERFKSVLLQSCFDAVYLVQEACFRACQTAGVQKTCASQKMIGASVDARALVKEIVDEQAGRYSAFLTNFAEGFQKTDLEMYKWVLYAVISTEHDGLENGLRRQDISLAIKGRHPEGRTLNEGNITQALQNTASLQVNKSVRPIILDYDQTTKVVSVVDRSFLIWLAYQSREELLAELDIVAVD